MSLMTPYLAVLLLFLAALARGADPIYLALLKGTNALVYLATDGKVLSSVPVGEHPHEMAFSPDRKLLYTTDNGVMRIEHQGKGGNTISIIDVASRKRIGVIPLGDFYRPHGIDVDERTGMLAVTVELPDRLLIVDPLKRRVVKDFDTKGKTSHMVTLGPAAQWAYVSNSGSADVAAINVTTGETKLIKTGERPEGGVLSRDGKELYVTNREAGLITVIDTAKHQPVAHIQTGKGPVRIGRTPDGNTLVYALMHEKKVAFADPKQRMQTGYVIVPGEPISCHVSRDGKRAFVSTETTDTIYVISIADKKIVGEIKLPQGSAPDPVVELQ